MLRLFETGHLEEPRFVEELRGIGCVVHSVDPNGEQFEFTDLGGHFACHPDAVILGLPESSKTWHIGEFKTMNANAYKKVERAGVKREKPQHYAQMMVGMGMAGLQRAFYLVKNKDTDELYSERIKFDKDEFKHLQDRACRVIESPNPLERCTDRPDDYRCKFCDAYDLCYADSIVKIPEIACRSCCHATAEVNGDDARWSCAVEGDMKPCDRHLLLPGLVPFADPTDSSDGWIEFTNRKDGTVWKHGNAGGMWTTEELMRTPADAVGDKGVQTIKEGFDATVISCDKKLTLIEKYPPEDSELIWEGPDEFIARAINDLKALELTSGESSDMFEDDKHKAWELKGEYLAVIYKGEDYAAIWRGKE